MVEQPVRRGDEGWPPKILQSKKHQLSMLLHVTPVAFSDTASRWAFPEHMPPPHMYHETNMVRNYQISA